MKSLLKYDHVLAQNLIWSNCTTQIIRLSRTALIIPFVAAGVGYFPRTVQAQIRTVGNNGCPAGTTKGTDNFIVNGNFAQGNTGFTSELRYLGDNTYGDGYTIINNRQTFINSPGFRGDVLEPPEGFPGDSANNVPSSTSYFYSNPSNEEYVNSNGTPTLWQQTLNVKPNTTYNFIFYIDNVLRVSNGDPASDRNPDGRGYPPVIQLRVSDGTTPPTNLGSPTAVRTVPNEWVPVQVAFTTGPSQTTAILSLVDAAGEFFGIDSNGSYRAVYGDDFAFTAIALNECIPNRPRLGVAKAAGTTTDNNDGSFTVPYTIRVQNYGDVELNNLQVTEDLSETFAQASEFNVVSNSINGNGVTVNPNFNGTSNTNLLAGTDSLAVGASATIRFNVRVTPGNNLGPYNNTAVGTATGANNTGPVTDNSTDGTNPDPDGDRNPTNNSVPTRVVFSSRVGNNPTANLRLVKRITAANRNGTPINGISFSDVELDTTEANAINDAGLRPTGVRTIPETKALLSGDEVEYTIYFLSDGNQPANNVNFCDLIPIGTTYVTNSTQIKRGNAQPTSGGNYFENLMPLPQNNPCADQTNPNGAVIVNLGNVANSAGSNFGFVRFRVKIN